MTRIWTCIRCKSDYNYDNVDNQINDSVYAYCSDCGTTLLMSTPKARELLDDKTWYNTGYEVGACEKACLPCCTCGGSFERGAAPRCPSCGREISQDEITSMLCLDAQPKYQPGKSTLGDLQECLIINDKAVRIYE